jgi:hypothetical protein
MPAPPSKGGSQDGTSKGGEGEDDSHTREYEQDISAGIEEEALMCSYDGRSLSSAAVCYLSACAPACPSLSPSPSASYSRGSPATFGVTAVITGWTEILQVMSVGDIDRVTIPSGLAYAVRGARGLIGPNAVRKLQDRTHRHRGKGPLSEEARARNAQQ